MHVSALSANAELVLGALRVAPAPWFMPLQLHRGMVHEDAAAPGLSAERVSEAMDVRHCTLSLVETFNLQFNHNLPAALTS